MAATTRDASKAMQKVPADEARQVLGDLIDRAFKGERMLITRHGKPAAALVSVADAERLQRLPAA